MKSFRILKYIPGTLDYIFHTTKRISGAEGFRIADDISFDSGTFIYVKSLWHRSYFNDDFSCSTTGKYYKLAKKHYGKT